MTASTSPTLETFSGGLGRGQFLAITSLFWVYVTVSHVVYAYSMGAGISRTLLEPLFAPWNIRLLQHALLLPFLTLTFWASLRLQWRPLWLAIPLQGVLAGAFAAVAHPAMLVAQRLFDGSDTAPSLLFDPAERSMWLASFVSFLPAYGFGLALITGLALYTRFRNSELRIAALERDWSAARLAALRMQLSPHTLFNLLHSIRGHIEWDPGGAQAMVVQLADLLRRVLRAGEREFSQLSEELHFVTDYLELQQRRFAERLTIVLPDPKKLPIAWVPSLILQPLVENAVVHGLAGHHGPVEVRIAARVDGAHIVLTITNTLAQGRACAAPGIGVQNVRERLTLHFGPLASLDAGPQGALWRSEITMPRANGSPEPQRACAQSPGIGV